MSITLKDSLRYRAFVVGAPHEPAFEYMDGILPLYGDKFVGGPLDGKPGKFSFPACSAPIRGSQLWVQYRVGRLEPGGPRLMLYRGAFTSGHLGDLAPEQPWPILKSYYDA